MLPGVSALWVLPIVVVAIGMVAVAAVSRHAAIAASDLQHGCADLAELGDQITALQGVASVMRRSVEELRTRRALPDTVES
jgi:hypothetical protein